MPRATLTEANIHPAIRDKITKNQQTIVAEVQAAVAANPVVVIGMGLNPMPQKARKALDTAGISHYDLDYGSYLSEWRRRNALKMWTGWPTFPMIFVKGTLVGGAEDVIKLINSGELKKLLA